jgi:ubiquinol-cytochrome c reductase cytochrome b subunit
MRDPVTEEGMLREAAGDSTVEIACHATRMTEDQIIRQVLQGGGNMPASGNALNPPQTKALVSFLMTLRGNDLSPAVDASKRLADSSQLKLLSNPSSAAPPKAP